MHKLNYIFKNVNLLNIILIATIIVLANYILLPIFNKSVKFKLPPVKQTTGNNEEKPAESQIPFPSDYIMIAEDNLFHPERKIPETKGEQSLQKPEFVLYGTLITDKISLAYLEDLKAPNSTEGRGKRQTVLKKGDALSGYTLQEIEADKIAMVRGDERMVVYLNDPTNPKKREVTEVATAATPAVQKPQRESTHARTKSPPTPRVRTERTTPPAPSVPKGGFKSAPQEQRMSSRSMIDRRNNITPGGFLYDRLHR
jgi:hypothetical protein